jgi:hypothetical protein
VHPALEVQTVAFMHKPSGSNIKPEQQGEPGEYASPSALHAAATHFFWFWSHV